MTKAYQPRRYSAPSSLPNKRAGRGSVRPQAASRAQPRRYPFNTTAPNTGTTDTSPICSIFTGQLGERTTSPKAMTSVFQPDAGFSCKI